MPPLLTRTTDALGDDYYVLAKVLTAVKCTYRETAKFLGISASSVSRLLKNGAPSKRKKSRKVSTAAQKKRIARCKLVAKQLKESKRKGLQPSLVYLRKSMRVATGKTFSRETIRQDLHREGLSAKVRPRVPRHLPQDAARKRAFAKEELQLPKIVRDRTVFTDEKRFTDSDFSNRFDWVKVNELPRRRTTARWGSSVLVWGAIGRGIRFIRIFKAGTRLDGHAYKTQVLIPFFKHLRDRFPNKVVRFQHDNAPCHSAKAVRAYIATKVENGDIESITSWPPRSPELSPIENCWAIVQKRVSDRILEEESDAREGVSVERLKTLVEEEWQALPEAIIVNLIESYDERLRRALKR